VTAAPPDRLEI
jgi:hypothetical protein